MKRVLWVLALVLSLALVVPTSVSAATVNYADVYLSGGFQSGHFDDIWDLTAGDMTLSFTYNGTGMVDDPGAHAWAELGVRSLSSGAADFNPYWRYAYQTIDLLADQTTDAGDVQIWSDGANLYVRYETSDGWLLAETHLQVATSLADIPQTKNGNPIPGRFSEGESYDPPQAEDTFTFNLADNGWIAAPVFYIAAHAAVVRETSTELIANGGFEVPALAGSWGIVPLSDTSLAWTVAPVTAWDEGEPQGLELQRIWTPDSGVQYAELDAYCPVAVSQNIGPCGDGLYSLRYAWSPRPGVAQNAMEVWWNGSLIATHSASGVGNSDTAWSHETFAFMAGPSASPFTLEFRETGPNDQLGMLLDSVSVVCAQKESAWADGTQFAGSNWATYATYMRTTEAGSGVWLATDYDWTAGTFDPDVTPTLDLDDKLILQRRGGYGEGDYDLPSTPPAPGNNHRIWWDRDGVDPWQNPATANTGGIYQIVITLHATSAATGTAYMNIRGLDQGFETDGNWNTIELTPAGMTFTGDMEHLQVFYGLYGYGATHTASFTDITVSQ